MYLQLFLNIVADWYSVEGDSAASPRSFRNLISSFRPRLLHASLIIDTSFQSAARHLITLHLRQHNHLPCACLAEG